MSIYRKVVHKVVLVVLEAEEEEEEEVLEGLFLLMMEVASL